MFRYSGSNLSNRHPGRMIERACSSVIKFCETPEGLAILTLTSGAVAIFGFLALMKMVDDGDDAEMDAVPATSPRWR